MDCSGYPEPRIFYETQSWWEPLPVVGGQGHIHLGTCWPHRQTVRGTVRLDLRVLLHFQAGTIVQFKVQDDFSANYRSQVSIPIVYADESIVEHTMFIDTSLQPDGLRQWRIYVYVNHPNGNSQRAKAMYQVRVDNVPGSENEVGPQYADYGGSGWYVEAGPPTTDWGYQSARIDAGDQPAIGACVPDLWTFDVDMPSTSTEHLVTVDPHFHAGDIGLVLHSGPNAYDGPVTLDTRALTDGWHKLVVHSGKRVEDRENGGAFLIPFLVC